MGFILKMIEIHCHLIPGIDDGAADLTVSQAMLADYHAQGVDEIICTPHFEPVNYISETALDDYFRLRQKQYDSLREHAEKHQPEINLHLGTEIMLSSDCPAIIERYGRNLKLTLAESDYILVELPRYLGGGYKLLNRLLFNLQISGFIPIMAHPERSMSQDGMFETLLEWYDQGYILLQVNASSMVHDHRISQERQERYSRRKKHVGRLLDREIVHFVSSDAHNIASRPPQNKLAYDVVAKDYGIRTAEELFTSNARKIINHQNI
jgi:protein-tyrosine phosphatase